MKNPGIVETIKQASSQAEVYSHLQRLKTFEFVSPATTRRAHRAAKNKLESLSLAGSSLSRGLG